MTYLDKIYTLYLLKNIHILVFLSLFIGLNTSLTAATSYGLYSLGIEDSEYSYDLENGRNLPLALELARASSLAYENFLWESDREFFADNGFESSNIKFFNFPLPASIAGIRPYLRGVTLSKQVTIDGINKKLVIISFKGTSHLPDYVADAVAYPSKFQENETIKVHSGFHAFFKVARANEANISIDTDTLDNAINDPKTIFVITGHSLGGAIAKLYGASLRERGIDENRLLVYTYGAPPVGFGDENSFEARYNPYSGDKAVRIRDAANQLDPVYHLAYIKLPKLPILTHSGTLYMPFNRYGNLKSIDSGCNLAEFLSIIPGGKILANANNFDNKPLCDLTFSAHKLGGYIKNLYNHIDFSELSNNLIAEGLAGITFDEHELLVLETIVTNPRYQKAISGQTFDATQLTDEDRKQLLQDIKATGVPISSKNFGNLGVKILASIKDAVDSKKDAIEQAKNEINSNQELHFDEYKKLAFGSAINVVTGVSDILTLGSSSLAIKMPKLTAASGKLANIVSKTTPLMTKAIKITETKKFIFLKALIESNFVVTDNIKGMIDRDAATGDLVSNIIGVGGDLSKSTLTAKMDNTTKGKFAAAFVGLLNDVVTKMIQEGTKSLIEDKEVRDTIDEFLSAVTELIPIAGPYFAQWHLGKKVSEDIDNKPEVKQAWANFNNLYDQIFAQLDAVGEVGFKKRLDVIMNSALKQIKEKHVALQESEEEPQAGAFFILPSTATLQDYVISATVGDEIKLIPTDEAPYLMEHIKEAIDSSQPLVLWYYDVTSQTRKSIPLTVDNYNGGNFFVLHFTAPSAQFQPVSIAYDRNGDSQYTINADLPSLWGIEITQTSDGFIRADNCPVGATDIACEVGIYSKIIKVDSSSGRGNIYSIKVNNGFIYILRSNTIVTVNINDSTTYVSSFEKDIQMYSKMLFVNNHIYIIGYNNYQGYLQVIDNTTPENLKLVSTTEMGRWSRAELEIIDNKLIVASTHGLYTYNISDLDNITLESFHQEVVGSNIKVYGDIVYQLTGNGIRSTNIITGNSVITKLLNRSNLYKNMEIYNNKIYIGGNRLSIYSLGAQGNPILESQFDDISLNFDVQLRDGVFFDSERRSFIDLKKLSVSNRKGNILDFLRGSFKTIDTDGVNLYGLITRQIGTNESELFIKVVDVSNYSKSSIKNIIPADYDGILLQGEYIASIVEDNTIQVKDLSGSIISSTTSGNNPWKIEKISTNLVIAESETIDRNHRSLDIYDFSNIDEPLLKSTILLENIHIWNYFYLDNYLYISTLNRLYIYNLSTLEFPALLSSKEFGSNNGLSVYKNIVYLGNKVIDVSDKTNPELISELEIDGGSFVNEGYLYAQNYSYPNEIVIYNITNPIDPILVSRHELFDISVGNTSYKRILFNKIIFMKNLAFLSTTYGIYVIDISSPEKTKHIGILEESKFDSLPRGNPIFEILDNYIYIFLYDGVSKILKIDYQESLKNKIKINGYLYPSSNVFILTNKLEKLSSQPNKYIRTWVFNKNINDFHVNVISNSYLNTINDTNFAKDANVLSISLSLNTSIPVNKLELEFINNSYPVTVNNSDTFWSLTKTNNAPRLADGQSTQLVSLTSEPAYLQINTYDADNDAVILSIEDDAGGYVGFEPQEPNNLFASFSDGKTHHTIKVGLNDGKEKVIYSFDVNQFNSSNIQTYYTDIDPNSNQYPFSGIALGTLMGVISGQLDPNDPTKKIFKPLDKASLAETLKIIINSASTAGLIQVHPANEYIQTYPTWAMPYYTYARDRGAVDVINNNISAVYPTREQVAKLVVKILGLDEKLLEFTNINVSFSDEAEFSNEAMKRYAQIVHFFGLFMTEETANPQQTINRAELALIIEKIFMTPTATDITFNPVNIEYGTSFIASLIGVKAQAIGSSFMPYDNSANIQAAFLSNTQVLPSPIDSNKLLTGINTLYAVINNNGVKNIISRPLTINFTDTDSDGIKDSVDLWVDDGRYAYDSNQNGIPDVLDNLLGLTIYTLNDDIKVEGGTIQIRDIINYGGIREEDIQQEAANVEVIIPILQLLLGE